MARFVVCLLAAAVFAVPAGAAHLTNPESVLVHKGTTYVSVIGEVGATDGSIEIVDRKGNVVRTLVDAGDVKDPKGMAVVGKRLWVADVQVLRSFDLATGAPKATVDLDAEFANDVVADGEGNLWVSDTRADVLYRVNKKRAVKRFALPAKFAAPNGVAIHPRTDQLWFVTSAGAGGSEVVRRTNEGAFRLVKKHRSFAGLDGLVFVGGSAIFTDFMTGALWRLTRAGKLSRRGTINGSPADLAYSPALKRLLIPLLDSGHLLVRKP